MARRVKLILQAAAVLVVVLLVALLGWKVTDVAEGRGLDAALERGERPVAPQLVLDSLDGEGEIRLADYRGKAVVLNFWASWCEPCKDEAPLLEDVWQRYRDDGLVVLGVDAQDFRSDAQRFVDRFGLTYPMAFDGHGSSLGKFGNTGFPETWFVGRDGRLVGDHFVGPFTREQLEENVRAALDTPAR
ncbi:MAG TPA: TlpA disulfide reductase family protein [Gaiellaceae bacterium]|nr:TlpA disulfide reductase family protein [Gaiellaceae bacterium]